MNDRVADGAEAASDFLGELFFGQQFDGVQHAVPCPVVKVNEISCVLLIHFAPLKAAMMFAQVLSKGKDLFRVRWRSRVPKLPERFESCRNRFPS